MYEEFQDAVRRALANFYDPAYLETDPLSDILALAQDSQSTPGLRLRVLLSEAVERLKPQGAIPFGRQEWFPYRILRQRYLEAMDIDAICGEIGLSRTSYYRYHRLGLQAVAEILWREHGTSSPSPDTTGKAPSRAVTEARRLTQTPRQERIDLEEVLESVMATIQPLANGEGVTVQVALAGPLPIVCGDHVVLRQILLNLLSEGLSLSVGERLHLLVSVEEERICWTLEGLRLTAEQAADPAMVPGFGVSQALLTGCGGAMQVGCSADGNAQICLEMPNVRPTSILILDDNPETVALYTRYLRDCGFQLLCANCLADYRQLVRSNRPDLVLLDVLMPDEDGWTVLQEIKLAEEMVNVPVLICSVLSQPRLALALGADAVLQKPVDQEVLVQTIARLLNPQGSLA